VTAIFGLENGHRGDRRRWTLPFLVAVILHGVFGVAIIVFSGERAIRMMHEPIAVTFVEKVIKPEPMAPPPDAAPQPPAAPAPVARPEQKVRKLDVPPQPKKLVAPRVMPKETPREADPSEDRGVAAVGDDGKGDAAGLEGGVTAGGVVGGVAGGAIQLPQDAVPPKPVSTNRIPTYPEEARADGRTGAVVLEIVVLANGTVGTVRVVRGDEPFASAAVETVKSWRYEPARYKGLPISVYRTFQVTFRLTG
jgi:protein TonB